MNTDTKRVRRAIHASRETCIFENRETSPNGKSLWGTLRSTGSPAGEGNGRNTGREGGQARRTRVRAAHPQHRMGMGGVRQRARGNKGERFTTLLHHLAVDLLRESEIPLNVPVMEIVAPLSTAPVLSGTVPRIVPVVPCAASGAQIPTMDEIPDCLVI